MSGTLSCEVRLHWSHFGLGVVAEWYSRAVHLIVGPVRLTVQVRRY